jgi:hypothetical protein
MTWMIRTCAALSERNTDAEAVMDLLALDEIVPRNVSRLRVAEKRVPTSTISTASFLTMLTQHLLWSPKQDWRLKSSKQIRERR